MGDTDIRVVWQAMQAEGVLTKMLGTPANPHVTLEEFTEIVNHEGVLVRSLNGPGHSPDVLILLHDVIPGRGAICSIGALKRAWGRRVRDFALCVMDEVFSGPLKLQGLVAFPCWPLGMRFAEEIGFETHASGVWILPAERFLVRRSLWVG